MKKKIVLEGKAEKDLLHIKEYIARDSAFYANKTTIEIDNRINNLSLFPEMGRYVPELDSKIIRELIYKSYRILYRIKGRNVQILRIFHHSQNILNFKSELSKVD